MNGSSSIVRHLALRYRRWARSRAVADSDSIMRAARATMRRKKYCVLTTHGEEGIDARVLQPFPPDDELGVWLGTSGTSRKVAQLRANPNATLVYEDDRRGACVVLVGEAQVVDDLEVRRARFMPSWWAFFPDGPTGDDYVSIHFVPRRIEVWDAARRITPEPFGLRSAVIVRVPQGATTDGWSLA